MACRKNGLVLSVDNPVPQYTSFYDRNEQGIVADYVIIMGYDEHTVGSEEAGSVASLPFVEEGITQTLEEVPKEKVITACLLYPVMDREQQWNCEQRGVQYGPGRRLCGTVWNGSILEYRSLPKYAEAATDGGVLKMWMEDEESLEEKMKLIQEYDLARSAEWKLGFERADVWAIISKYIQ